MTIVDQMQRENDFRAKLQACGLDDEAIERHLRLMEAEKRQLADILTKMVPELARTA